MKLGEESIHRLLVDPAGVIDRFEPGDGAADALHLPAEKDDGRGRIAIQYPVDNALACDFFSVLGHRRLRGQQFLAGASHVDVRLSLR